MVVGWSRRRLLGWPAGFASTSTPALAFWLTAFPPERLWDAQPQDGRPDDGYWEQHVTQPSGVTGAFEERVAGPGIAPPGEEVPARCDALRVLVIRHGTHRGGTVLTASPRTPMTQPTSAKIAFIGSHSVRKTNAVHSFAGAVGRSGPPPRPSCGCC